MVVNVGSKVGGGITESMGSLEHFDQRVNFKNVSSCV